MSVKDIVKLADDRLKGKIDEFQYQLRTMRWMSILEGHELDELAMIISTGAEKEGEG